MGTFKKILFSIIIVGLLFIAFMMFGSYGDGYRAGALTKVSRKGVLFKTNEGEMFIGTSIENSDGDVESGGVINNIWYFSIKNDDELLKKLDDALLNGHRVKLHYYQKYWKLFWVGDTKYIVDEMEVIKELDN
ncbi:MAG: hypothetical protein ACTHJT_01555 [Cytophaga sp.]|uniref:hypothetical protein n=1 Tax=Cytophaga sp. TaxID=29535 RepID=UPI003F7E386C